MAGQYLDSQDTANLICQTCAYDSYQDEIWQDSCKLCTANRVTLQTGTTREDLCVGKYNFYIIHGHQFLEITRPKAQGKIMAKKPRCHSHLASRYFNLPEVYLYIVYTIM